MFGLPPIDGQVPAYSVATPTIPIAHPSRLRRASQIAFVNALRSNGSLPVAREEQLLQVGFLGQQAHHRVPRGRLDQRVRPTGEPAAQHRAVRAHVADAGQRGELVRGYRRLEVDLDPAYRPLTQRLDLLDRDQPPLADDPDPVGGLLYLAHHVRGDEDRLPGRLGLPYHRDEL